MCWFFFSINVLEFWYGFLLACDGYNTSVVMIVKKFFLSSNTSVSMLVRETPNAAGTDGVASGEAAFIWFLRGEGS